MLQAIVFLQQKIPQQSWSVWWHRKCWEEKTSQLLHRHSRVIKFAIIAISVRVPKKAQRGFGGKRERERSPRQPSTMLLNSPRENILPSILSVPLWTISKRLLLCSAAPSLSHLICGVDGVPVARHVSIATLPFGRVWFDGPIWMMGGGMSSADVTWKR